MSSIFTDTETIRQFIKNEGPASKFYFGCDSNTYRKKNGDWYVTYVSVIVIHHNGRNGAKLFGRLERQPFRNNKLRLLTEVFHVVDFFLEFADVIGDRYHEIHLDINPDKRHLSNAIMAEALGYVQGLCNVKAKVKPEAFASTCAADRLIQVGY